MVIGFHLVDEENGCLSNWYPSPFALDGIRFCCAEQYMMYMKAKVFCDEYNAALILAAEDPAEIKAYGRAVTGYDDRVWAGLRQLIVYDALKAKFTQNPELASFLRSTGSAILAECARGDTVWGIGLGMDDERRHTPSLWKGQNLLGFTLMKVRDDLAKTR